MIIFSVTWSNEKDVCFCGLTEKSLNRFSSDEFVRNFSSAFDQRVFPAAFKDLTISFYYCVCEKVSRKDCRLLETCSDIMQGCSSQLSTYFWPCSVYCSDCVCGICVYIRSLCPLLSFSAIPVEKLSWKSSVLSLRGAQWVLQENWTNTWSAKRIGLRRVHIFSHNMNLLHQDETSSSNNSAVSPQQSTIILPHNPAPPSCSVTQTNKPTIGLIHTGSLVFRQSSTVTDSCSTRWTSCSTLSLKLCCILKYIYDIMIKHHQNRKKSGFIEHSVLTLQQIKRDSDSSSLSSVCVFCKEAVFMFPAVFIIL